MNGIHKKVIKRISESYLQLSVNNLAFGGNIKEDVESYAKGLERRNQ